MLYDAIDCVCLAAPDLEAACRPYERLGLRLSPAHEGRRSLHVGGGTNLFTVHFLAEGGLGGPAAGPLGQALAAGRALFAVGLRAPDFTLAVRELTGKGVSAALFRDRDAEAAWLPLCERAGTDLVLVRQATPQARHARAKAEGLLDHSFPLKRLDHLAVVTHDLEAKTAFWSGVLGVPVAGEVVTPTLVIRQLRLGDAVLELLGPASEGSPLWKRPPGLVNMASWEVNGLERAVRLAREAGHAVPDPAPGPLPGTRIATVPGEGLAGVNMQLLEYV
jgi:catechol 2,3-dioxygenase-like lactoylglutathione lyase family enzyme